VVEEIITEFSAKKVPAVPQLPHPSRLRGRGVEVPQALFYYFVEAFSR
jgi:hypothetical protein